MEADDDENDEQDLDVDDVRSETMGDPKEGQLLMKRTIKGVQGRKDPENCGLGPRPTVLMSSGKSRKLQTFDI